MSQIQITCETENANIYYTLNGENPTSNSTLYSSPFEVNETCTVKAIGYKEGYLESDVLEKDLIKLPTPQISSIGNKRPYRTFIVLNNLNDYTPYVNEEENNISFILEYRNDINEIRANKTYKEIKESEDNYLYRSSNLDAPSIGGPTYFATATSTDYITSEEGSDS